MAWFKRISLFMIVNLFVIVTISLILNFFGFTGYLTAQGIDYQALMVFCLVWGMGGSLISLFMSKAIAKWSMGVQVISPQTRDSELSWLLETVHNQARAAGLPKMPEVGIYDSPIPNAFATGPSRSNSLVAVSTGLLNRMDKSQLEGVLGHEVSHVANGDMVTMVLIQGIVNAFVMFLARVIAFAIANSGRSSDDRGGSRMGASYYLVQFALEIVLGFLGMMVVAWFSRYREFRADAGGARLAGQDKMIAALDGLRRLYDPQVPTENASVATLQISGKSSSWLALFSTHPPLEARIQRLETMRG